MTASDVRARTAIAALTARVGARSAVLWGYVFGAVVASSALSYLRLYKTRAERESLAASFGSNHAAIALFGPAPQLQTVAGFTVFKSSLSIVLIGAVWGILLSTRVLRGEEDTGRVDALLSGQATLRSSVLQTLAGLGVVAFVPGPSRH